MMCYPTSQSHPRSARQRVHRKANPTWRSLRAPCSVCNGTPTGLVALCDRNEGLVDLSLVEFAVLRVGCCHNSHLDVRGFELHPHCGLQSADGEVDSGLLVQVLLRLQALLEMVPRIRLLLSNASRLPALSETLRCAGEKLRPFFFVNPDEDHA